MVNPEGAPHICSLCEHPVLGGDEVYCENGPHVHCVIGRRRWLMQPMAKGILATNAFGQVRGAGCAAGANDPGPREAVLGRNLQFVGWRRGRSGKA